MNDWLDLSSNLSNEEFLVVFVVTLLTGIIIGRFVGRKR